MMNLIRTQQLQDVVDDLKEEIREYEKLRNWTIFVGASIVAVFCALVTVGIISHISNTVDLGPGIFGLSMLDIFAGGGGVAALWSAAYNRRPKRLRQRLKTAERAYRDAMAEMGLG